MDIKDEFKYLVGGYFGVREMDDYDLKVFILKDIENYIKGFVLSNPVNNFDYKLEADIINKELSLKTKLQDALIVLNKINAPMDLVFLIKQRLENFDEEKIII